MVSAAREYDTDVQGLETRSQLAQLAKDSDVVGLHHAARFAVEVRAESTDFEANLDMSRMLEDASEAKLALVDAQNVSRFDGEDYRIEHLIQGGGVEPDASSSR